MNQPETNQPDCWTFFDKIYCITLETRPDRTEKARKQFENVGLLQRVEFVVVAKHPDNQEEGIFQSHMNCLKQGLKEKAGNILIFEDDVFFRGLDKSALHEVCSYLDSGIKWNAFFLGCITDGSQKTEKMHLAKITYRCLAHAYVLNQPFAKHFVQKKWRGIPFDELLRRHSKDFYALHPMCAFQGLSGTDNQTVVIDRIRRLLGGLPFIQKANELYQNRKAVLLSTMGVMLMLALLTFRLW